MGRRFTFRDNSQRAGRRGHAALETALLLPWLVFSFIGLYDLGSATYALVSTQSAARAAATWASYSAANAGLIAKGDLTKVCSYARAELLNAPGVGSGTTTCNGGSKVGVSATAVTGADTYPAVSVTVTYSLPLIPIPGIISNKLVCSRTVILTVRG